MAQIVVKASEETSNVAAQGRKACGLLRAAGIDAWTKTRLNSYEGVVEVDDAHVARAIVLLLGAGIPAAVLRRSKPE